MVGERDAADADLSDVMENMDVSEDLADQDDEVIDDIRENPVSKADRPEQAVSQRLDKAGSHEKDAGKHSIRASKAHQRLTDMFEEDGDELRGYLRNYDADGDLLNAVEQLLDAYPSLVWSLAMESRILLHTLRQVRPVIDDQQRSHDERYIIDNMDKQVEMFAGKIENIGESVVERMENHMDVYRDSMKQTYDVSREVRKTAEALERVASEMPTEKTDTSDDDIQVEVGGDGVEDKVVKMLEDTDKSIREIAEDLTVIGYDVSKSQVQRIKDDNNVERPE